MNIPVSNRLGLAMLLCGVLAIPLCGCSDPNGVQENPYAAPAAEDGSGTGEEQPAATEADSPETAE